MDMNAFRKAVSVGKGKVNPMSVSELNKKLDDLEHKDKNSWSRINEIDQEIDRAAEELSAFCYQLESSRSRQS